jgi:hypothetical protein
VNGRASTVLALALIAATVVALDLLGRRTARIPTLGAIAGALCRRHPGRIALFAVWAWTGWHLFAR